MMKPFCVLPYVQFSTTVSGDYQACCIAKQQKENIIDKFRNSHFAFIRPNLASKFILVLKKLSA